MKGTVGGRNLWQPAAKDQAAFSNSAPPFPSSQRWVLQAGITALSGVFLFPLLLPSPLCSFLSLPFSLHPLSLSLFLPLLKCAINREIQTSPRRGNLVLEGQVVMGCSGSTNYQALKDAFYRRGLTEFSYAPFFRQCFRQCIKEETKPLKHQVTHPASHNWQVPKNEI